MGIARSPVWILFGATVPGDPSQRPDHPHVPDGVGEPRPHRWRADIQTTMKYLHYAPREEDAEPVAEAFAGSPAARTQPLPVR